jgi:hypothetical protein
MSMSSVTARDHVMLMSMAWMASVTIQQLKFMLMSVAWAATRDHAEVRDGY